MRLATLASLAAAAAGSEVHIPRGSEDADKRVSATQAVATYAGKITHWKDSSSRKRAMMTPHDALKGIKKHLSDEEHEHLASLLSEGEEADPGVLDAATGAKDQKDLKLSAAPKESKLQKLTRAVQTLNKMYLRIDLEKVTTETRCVVDIQNMFYTDDQYWHEFDKYRNVRFSLAGENNDLATEIQESKADLKRKTTAYDQQHADNKAFEKQKRETEYNPAQADVELFEFIADEVDSNCGAMLKTIDDKNAAAGSESAGSASPEPTLLQTDTEVCVAGASVSDALVSVFSDPAIKEKLDSMPLEKRRRLEQEIGAMGGDDDDAASFMQMGQKPADGKPHGKGKPVVGDTSQSQWASSKGSPCGSGSVSCNDLRTIVGQELVCKRRIRDLEASELEETEEKHKAERDTNNMALQDVNRNIAALQKQIKDNKIESAAALEQQKITYKALKQHEADTNERLHECFERLAELYENSYCACGALRDFMFSSAKKEYRSKPPADAKKKGYKADFVQDCKWEPGFKPDGTPCMLGDQVIECMEPGPDQGMPQGNKPTRTWVRKVTKRNDRHPLAMPCPTGEAVSMKITCNNYLCPVDCQTTEDQVGKCDSDCTDNEPNGVGTRTLTKEVIVPEKYLGKDCPALIATEDCVDNSKCPVHCKQAPRHYQCAEACNAGGRSQRVRALSYGGRMKVWNQVKKMRTLVAPQNGGTECEPEGKGLFSKDWSRGCRKAERRCTNSEVCTEQRDILIAFECSSGMEDGYLGSACRMTIDMVRQLIKKMYSDYMSIPMIRVGVIKFGNGKTEKDDGTGEQLISEVQVVSGFTGKIDKLANNLDTDDAYNNPKEPWHFGFPNYNMLFEKAKEMFANADDPKNGKRRKSFIIFTKGRRADCALEMHKIAKQFHAEGTEIVIQLFAHNYESKPQDYAAIRDVASYPADVHFRVAKGYSELLAGRGLVQNIIPRVCKEAKPRWRLTVGVSRWRWARYRQIHKGRICKTWRIDIFKRYRFRGWKSMRACADAANRRGYKGALYVRTRSARSYGARCLVHWRHSRWSQVNHNGTINDKTCGCIGRNGRRCSRKNIRSQIRGWAAQDVDVANAKQEMAVHFRTRRDGRRWVRFSEVAGRAGKYEANYTPKAKGFL